MKLGRRNRATIIGAVRAMNPTKAVMKQGSTVARAQQSRANASRTPAKPQGKTK